MAKQATHSNHFDADIVNGALSRIDELDKELASAQGAYMSTCRGFRDQIKQVIEEAREKGIPSKEFRALVSIRRLEAKTRKIAAGLEPDQQDTLAMLAATEKVMDLPLWRVTREPIPEREPGVDVAREAAGEREPMWSDDRPFEQERPDAEYLARFKPLPN